MFPIWRRPTPAEGSGFTEPDLRSVACDAGLAPVGPYRTRSWANGLRRWRCAPLGRPDLGHLPGRLGLDVEAAIVRSHQGNGRRERPAVGHGRHKVFTHADGIFGGMLAVLASMKTHWSGRPSSVTGSPPRQVSASADACARWRRIHIGQEATPPQNVKCPAKLTKLFWWWKYLTLQRLTLPN